LKQHKKKMRRKEQGKNKGKKRNTEAGIGKYKLKKN
jgi:hypothetical protein